MIVANGQRKIVAIASSTGGPKALHQVIPLLPANFKVPVIIVQHMPPGFTRSLAERLDDVSDVRVKEAENGEQIVPGTVYIAKGGAHLKVRNTNGNSYIMYSDEGPREGVKPCADYMYEALIDSCYDSIICVVMTGMGADGTKGIQALKEKKSTKVIVQNKESCVVYGMPKCVEKAGLADRVVPLEQIAKEIIESVG